MIRFAGVSDIEKIMSFIDTYWRKGHILGSNRRFFEYEHLLPEGVTYVISENEKQEVNAILGYIPYGKTHRDIMTVMWKANHTAEPALGIELFNYLKDNADVRIMASPGSNQKLRGLYHYLGCQFGKMVHWYRLNSKKKSFRIAVIDDADIPHKTGSVGYVLYHSWDELNCRFDWNAYQAGNPKPYKEKWYIKKRYFDHPVYDYLVYGIHGDANKDALLMIFRIVALEGSLALRLIDCIGNYEYIGCSVHMLDELLDKYDAEYIDCYEIGLKDEVMVEGGFRKVSDTTNIIPNYFAPFVQENIDIYYFSTDKDIVLFKGDGDQDRPN
jgi:hypothetical protein